MINVTITDLANERRSDLIKLSQFLLEYAGYEAAVAAVPAVNLAPVPLPVPVIVASPTPEEAFIASAPTNVVPFAQAPGIEIDSAGMPWDGRIHASSRARVADGTWRQRRNLSEDVLSKVTSELHQTMGAPVIDVPAPPVAVEVPVPPLVEVPVPPLVEVPVPPLVEVPVPPPFVPSVVIPAAPVTIAPPPPSTPVGAAAIASPSNTAAVSFPQLMQAITRAFTAKTLNQASIASAVQSVGLPALPMLASRPDLVAAVATALGIAL